MVRFIGSFFGALFTAITLGLLFGALSVGAIFYIYSADLPSHESLAQYTPPTISRIYSGEGRIIDEFAQERRLFVAIWSRTLSFPPRTSISTPTRAMT